MRRLALLVIVGLGFAVLPLTAAAGGGCHAEGSALSTVDARGSAAANVDIGKCQFLPTTLWVDPGTKVTWENFDPVPHTVTGSLFVFGSDLYLNDGDQLSYTFDEEGVFAYSCILHPGMVASVVVGDGMGKAKTADNAGITIADDPEPPAEEAPAPRTVDATESSATDDGIGLTALAVSTAIVAIAAFALGVTYRRRRGKDAQAEAPAPEGV